MGYLKNTDVSLVNKSGVSILVGQAVLKALLPREVRWGKDYEPHAPATHLGWVLNGPLNDTLQNLQEAVCNFILAVEPHISLDTQVE